MATKKQSGFDWQTEDEKNPAPSPVDALSERRKRRRQLALYAAAFVGVLLPALLVYWQLRRQAQIRHDQAVADVLLAHGLMQQAVLRGDRELFLTLLSTNDGRWFAAQQTLFDQELFLERTPLGLRLARDLALSEAPAEAQVTLVADGRIAAVTGIYAYQANRVAGGFDTVLLERTLFYAREGDAWVHAPPPDEDNYWGNWVREESEHLLFLFSARDAEVGYRLSGELQTLVHNLCQDTLVSCPAGYKLRLRLSRDPASLRQVNRLLDFYPATAGQDMEMPAPSLVGKPLDETGYQALYQGYAGWAAAAMLSHLNQDAFFTHEHLSEQLARWQLWPPPLPGYQEQPATARPVAYPEQDIMLLCQSPLETTLIRFNLTTMTWQDELAGKLSLPADSGLTMLHLADGSDILLTYRAEVDGERERWHTRQWSNGAFQLLFEEPEQYRLIEHRLTPAGSYLFFNYSGSGPDTPRLVDLEKCLPDDCERLEVAGLSPAWSPDGTQTLALVYEGAGFSLHLGDRRAQNLAPLLQLHGRDGQPFIVLQFFWLDDRTFAYIQRPFTGSQAAPDEMEMVIASLSLDGQAATVATITAEDLVEAGARRRPGERLIIFGALANPRRPGEIVLAAGSWKGDGVSRPYDIISYDSRTQTAKLLYGVGYPGSPQVSFSPDGLFIITAAHNAGGDGRSPGEMLLHLYNQESGEAWSSVIPVFNFWVEQQYDWSAAGEWLLISEPGLLRLLAPKHHHEEFIYHRFQNCHQAAWLNR
jgi:hypothetical protein